ncbi:MAG: hypothetical protein V3S47_01450 [Acidobacteriota bacterium]
MNQQGVRFFSILVFLSFFAVSTLAAGRTPPQTRDCDADFAPSEYNDRIDCKAENANAALFEYVDTVIEFDKMRREFGRAPLFTDAQMDHLVAARDRAQSAKNRSHVAKAFRGQARKQKAEDEDCYVKEIIGDGIGNDIQPCEKNEDCAEVIGDDIGDEDGVCKIRGNPNLREVCVKVCQQPLLDDDDTYDSEASFDTEQGLEELEVVLGDATDEVKVAMARMQAYYSTRSNGPVDECEMFEFDLFPPTFALQASQVAKNVADAVFNSCSVACNQDVFGWNCEAACVVFAIISGVLNGVDDAFSVIDGANGSEQLDRVAKCNRQLNQKLIALATAGEETQGAIDDANAKMDALILQMEALTKLVEARFLDVEDQLCTPQGQRECFPDGAHRFSPTPEAETPDRPQGRARGR